MSPLDLWSWAAIVVLVVGSVAIFAWFVAEILAGRGPLAPRSREEGAGPRDRE